MILYLKIQAISNSTKFVALSKTRQIKNKQFNIHLYGFNTLEIQKFFVCHNFDKVECHVI
jgi:hypothetical protein